MQDKSIKKNYILGVILSMSSIIFPLISFPYVSRVLLSENMGKVSLATSVIYYFNSFAQLGIPTYGIRACANVRDNKTLLSKTAHELLFINLITSIVSYALLVVCIIYVPRLQGEKTLYIITSLNIFLSAIGMDWLYRSVEEYAFITKRTVILKVIGLAALFLLVRQKDDYIIYASITIFASSASSILNFIHARKIIDFKYIGNYNLKKHIKPILSFFGIVCATTIYLNLDVVMLGFMKSDIDVGYYNTAIKIKTALVSLVATLGNVILPRASYYIENNLKENFNNISRKSMEFTVMIALPICVYFIIFARPCILFISGADFMESILPMKIIMPTILFIGITNIIGTQMLVPLKRENDVLKSTVIGAIVDLILNAVLIPSYGASGAAAGTLAAEFAVFIYQVMVIRKEYSGCLKIAYKKILLGIIIAVLLSFGLNYLNIGNFPILVISSIIFFGIYFFSMYILKEEIAIECFNILKNLMSKRHS